MLRHEWMDAVRTVHLNTREHPANGPRTSLGHSIGYFEGDTLVIETANYSAGVLNQYVEEPGKPTRGLLHSAALTSVERLSFDKERQRLVVEVTLKDPEFFTRDFDTSRLGVCAVGPDDRAVQLLARRRDRHDQTVTDGAIFPRKRARESRSYARRASSWRVSPPSSSLGVNSGFFLASFCSVAFFGHRGRSSIDLRERQCNHAGPCSAKS